MKLKYKFPEFECNKCEDLLTHGSLIAETRYCTGIGKKRSKKFRSTDPKYKAPRWCPRRKTENMLRVYRLAGEMGRYFEVERRHLFNVAGSQYIHPSEYHYALYFESTTSLTAKEFYIRTLEEPSELLLSDIELDYGDVVEIDDGLNPYYFYYLSYGVFILASLFDRTRVGRAE